MNGSRAFIGTPLLRLCCMMAIACLGAACADSSTGNGGTVTDGVDVGPADGTASADCGNAVCEDGESFFSCRNDCKAPDYVACYAESCTTSWERCLDDQGCQDTMHCIELCTGDLSCQEECYFAASDEAQAIVDTLLACAGENDCHADTPGTEPEPDTCPGACGEYVEGASCQCEENCKVFNDCCEGYEALCESPESCGDAVCDNNEDARNCPATP